MSTTYTTTKPNPRRPANRLPFRPWLLAAPLLLLMIVSLLLTACGGDGEDEAAADKAVSVTVAAVTERSLSRYITFTAQTQPKKQVNLVAEVAGHVVSVPVSVGQWVAAGTVLVHLDTSTLAQQVNQADAGFKQAEAGLADAHQAYASAQREYDRMAPLYDAGAIPQKDWDQLTDGLERARLGAQVQAPALLQQAEAGLALARSQLDKAAIKAPMAGEVAAILTSAGNMVAPGTPVATVVDRSQIELTGVLSDRQVVQVQPNLPVEVTLGALPGQVFTGIVETVAPAANPQVGGFPLTIVLPNPDGTLRPGMVAEVRIPVEQLQSALAVPADALLQRNGEAVVFVVIEGKAVERVVTTGLSDGIYTAVTSGLVAGDQAITSGQHFVADGMTVQIQAGAETDADGADSDAGSDADTDAADAVADVTTDGADQEDPAS